MPSLRAVLFRNLLRAESRKTRRYVSIPALRRHMDRYGRLQRLPQGTTVTATTVANRAAEWITPPNAVAGRTLLYLHGGAYAFGSCDTHRALVARIARASRARALLLDYRLAPEHPFPAALDDARDAYEHLLESGHDPEQLVLMGDSAGGGLAVSLLVTIRDAGETLPAAAVLLSPWADLAGRSPSIRTRADDEPWLHPEFLAPLGALYAADHDLDHPLISPVYADLHGLPPLLLHVGTHEILLDDARRLAERTEAQGGTVTLKVWDGLFHVFHIFADYVPEAREATDEIGAFVLKHLADQRMVFRSRD